MSEKANLWPAALAGFDLIRNRPLTVLVWGLVVFGLTYGPMLLVFGLGGGSFLEFVEASFAAEDGVVDDQAAAAFVGFTFAMMGAALLAMIGMIVSYVVVYTAIWRAVLFPEATRNAYLRFGRAEGRVFLIMLILYALYYVAAMIPMNLAMFPLMFNFMGGIEEQIIAAEAGDLETFPFAPQDFIWFYAQMIAVAYLVSAALAWPFLRLAMALPMSLAENRMRVFEGWAFTRGHGWRLWGMYVAVMIVSGLISLLLGVLTTWAGLQMMGIGSLSDLFGWVYSEDPEAAFVSLFERALGLVWFWALSAFIVITLTQVIVYAPLARAYQLIADARDDGPEPVKV
jgi:hypothetical protein